MYTWTAIHHAFQYTRYLSPNNNRSLRGEVLPDLHADLFSRHASSSEVYVLWWSTKEVKMLCPTRFVVDATENSKEGGVAAEVCSSQTGLRTKLNANIALTWVNKMNSLSSGEPLNVVQKLSLFYSG